MGKPIDPLEEAISALQESHDWSMLTSAAGRVKAFQAGMVFARRTSDKLVTHCCTQCAHLPEEGHFEKPGKFACPACGVGLTVCEPQHDDLLRDAARLVRQLQPQIRGAIPLQDSTYLLNQLEAYFKARGAAV